MLNLQATGTLGSGGGRQILKRLIEGKGSVVHTWRRKREREGGREGGRGVTI